MKAAVLREVGQPLEIEDIEISKPKSREVLIRTSATGVCATAICISCAALTLLNCPLCSVTNRRAWWSKWART